MSEESKPAPDLENILQLLRTSRTEASHQLSQLRGSVRELAEEARITNAHIVGLARHDSHTDARIIDLQRRMERLEDVLAAAGVEARDEA